MRWWLSQISVFNELSHYFYFPPKIKYVLTGALFFDTIAVSTKRIIKKEITVSNISEGIVIFGVTSHSDVIPMRITAIKGVPIDDYSTVHVEAVDSNNGHAKAQVRLVFGDLLLFNGEINKEAVFTSEQDAKAFALKRANNELDALMRKVNLLRDRISKLSN